jgi:hypothetical protein
MIGISDQQPALHETGPELRTPSPGDDAVKFSCPDTQIEKLDFHHTANHQTPARPVI